MQESSKAYSRPFETDSLKLAGMKPLGEGKREDRERRRGRGRGNCVEEREASELGTSRHHGTRLRRQRTFA